MASPGYEHRTEANAHMGRRDAFDTLIDKGITSYVRHKPSAKDFQCVGIFYFVSTKILGWIFDEGIFVG